MYDRNRGTPSKLGYAPDVAGRYKIRLNRSDIGQLAIPQRTGNLWLQEIVGARRAATEMPFGDLYRLEAGGF